jgi:signal peptidase I
MENTLLVGDYLLVRVFPKPTVARGDLITFHYPIDRKEIFIKRIIGLPGDRVRIKDRVTFVNDHELREPYVILRSSSADDFRDNLPNSTDERALAAMPTLLEAHTEMLSNHVINGEVVVPPNKYFVLGDNRDNSLDSRYWGFVDEADLIGEPFLIYDSQERGNAELVGRPFKTHTRWARLCKVL